MQLREAIISAGNCASKDQTRTHLCGVNVRKADGGMAIVEATDGHVLTQLTVEVDEPLTRGFWVSNEAVRLVKTGKAIGLPCLTMVSEIAKTAHFGSLSIPVDFEVKYPNTEQLKPTFNLNTATQIAFDVDLLLK